MILFLTSSPCDDCVPEGVDLPCIFFERNRFVENLQSCIAPGSNFLVIAADPESYELNDEMAQTFADCFAFHDMEMAETLVLDGRTMDRAEELVNWSDVILLGGGHVPTEKAFFERIGLRYLLRNYAGVVMGVSAGSMNCASVVYAQPEEAGESLDPNYTRFFPGLGLTDVMILPHYQKVKNMILDGRRLYEDITYPDSVGHNFIALPDGSYIVEDEDGAEVFGLAYRISGGGIRTICEEEESISL